ncbi:MAG: biotin-dependent carboxyltransferase family protein [Dethiosulfatibacter sp.]|nr:biotin-dependent carboxyltransferase family protein [Dethiosulfatibacter sp.]
MNRIRIISPGMLSTIQDRGRMGYQQYGVTVSGATDKYSFQLANILVGNNRYEGCIEMTMHGATVEFMHKTAFAVTGADMLPTLNGKSIRANETVIAEAGDILKSGTAISGLRSYLALAGGFDVENVMGSKSTYLRGSFGGFKGRKLKSGDELSITSSSFDQIRMIPSDMVPVYRNDSVLSVIMGTEEEYFTVDSIETFLNSTYTITEQSDRMGIRLDGQPITHKASADILSSGITEGTIQVPKNGKPIIMMADRQTTGGYTRIASVISTDIPKLAQMKPGNTVRFQKISLQDAHDRIRVQEERILQMIGVFENQKRYFRVSINGEVFEVEIQDTL